MITLNVIGLGFFRKPLYYIDVKKANKSVPKSLSIFTGIYLAYSFIFRTHSGIFKIHPPICYPKSVFFRTYSVKLYHLKYQKV